MKRTVVSTVVAMLMLIVLGSIAFAPSTAVEVQVPFKGTTESDRLRRLITPMSSRHSYRNVLQHMRYMPGPPRCVVETRLVDIATDVTSGTFDQHIVMP